MEMYRVVYENTIMAEDELDAAKKIAAMLLEDEDANYSQYYVQKDYDQSLDIEVPKVVSVDLSEEDEDAVLPVDLYAPLIMYQDNRNIKKIGF